MCSNFHSLKHSIQLAICLMVIVLVSCQDTDEYTIMTVNGTIPSSDMGRTLIHEHVLVDWIGADSTGYHRWNREDVIERVLPFMMEVRRQGIRTILECTPAYLGRDPYILQELSRQSGIQILTNTGYYGAVENTFMPQHAWEESAEELADRWIDEFENGIDNSDIRPGFIKISVAGNGPLSDHHKKIVRAAAITHLETGLTIVSHTAGDEPAIEQIELLKESGVSPSAWVWTHAQSGTLETQIDIAREGAWISLDNFSYNPDAEPDDRGNLDWFVERIGELSTAGLLNRVLISHDAGYYNPDEQNGGEFREYTDIVEFLQPELLENGFTVEDVDQLLVQNPAEAYGIRPRKYAE